MFPIQNIITIFSISITIFKSNKNKTLPYKKKRNEKNIKYECFKNIRGYYKMEAKPLEGYLFNYFNGIQSHIYRPNQLKYSQALSLRRIESPSLKNIQIIHVRNIIVESFVNCVSFLKKD